MGGPVTSAIARSRVSLRGRRAPAAPLRLAGALAVALGMLVVVAGTAGGSAAGSLFVSPTGSNTAAGHANSCRLRADPCQTITFALSVAPTGAVLNLAGGTYDEQVQITQSVTIKGAGAGGANPTVIEPSSPSASDTDT